jgi:phosphoglycolate phosphatase-like HAD superfamily hydrolase
VGAAKAAIVAFVEQTVASGVPVEERIAVFDGDGTLWCEKPVAWLDFLFRRLAEMATADPKLRDRQPWKAAYERDGGWLEKAVAEYYDGDKAIAKTIVSGILGAYPGITVEEFEAKSEAFLRSAQHPTLGRGYLDTAFAPIAELLGYLQANGFSNHIVSCSDADFWRPLTEELFGIPPERVIGTTTALEYTSDEKGGALTRKAALDFLDDGPQKPIHIWSRLGRRPLLAGGNSNGDIPMHEFTQHQDRPSLRLLVLHDDAEREFAYTSGAEKALAEASRRDWTVVSMKNDFSTVFS